MILFLDTEYNPESKLIYEISYQLTDDRGNFVAKSERVLIGEPPPSKATRYTSVYAKMEKKEFFDKFQVLLAQSSIKYIIGYGLKQDIISLCATLNLNTKQGYEKAFRKWCGNPSFYLLDLQNQAKRKVFCKPQYKAWAKKTKRLNKEGKPKQRLKDLCSFLGVSYTPHLASHDCNATRLAYRRL